MKKIADSDGNIFGDPQPVSDFEKVAKATRGWSEGNIMKHPEKEEFDTFLGINIDASGIWFISTGYTTMTIEEFSEWENNSRP